MTHYRVLPSADQTHFLNESSLQLFFAFFSRSRAIRASVALAIDSQRGQLQRSTERASDLTQHRPNDNLTAAHPSTNSGDGAKCIGKFRGSSASNLSCSPTQLSSAS
jgi:hypothetical protein